MTSAENIFNQDIQQTILNIHNIQYIPYKSSARLVQSFPLTHAYISAPADPVQYQQFCPCLHLTLPQTKKDPAKMCSIGITDFEMLRKINLVLPFDYITGQNRCFSALY